jgi:hypothetical protein
MTTGLEWDNWHWRTAAGSLLTRHTSALALDLRHGHDLDTVVALNDPRWPDALALATRQQLEDCVLGAERAIVLRVEERPFEAMLGAIAPGFTVDTLRRYPALVSPELLHHMRQRAALSLVAQAGGWRNISPADPAVPEVELIAALNRAEQAWVTTASTSSAGPARADLPAELFCDLAWSAAALIVQGLEVRMGATSARAARAVAVATGAVLARHDEGIGGFALAARAARLIGERSNSDFGRQALGSGRLLVFAALVAHRQGLTISAVLDGLLDGGMRARFALLRLGEADDEAVAAFLAHVAPLRRGGGERDDIALAVENYRDFTSADAMEWLSRQTVPAPLAQRLALLDRPGP